GRRPAPRPAAMRHTACGWNGASDTWVRVGEKRIAAAGPQAWGAHANSKGDAGAGRWKSALAGGPAAPWTGVSQGGPALRPRASPPGGTNSRGGGPRTPLLPGRRPDASFARRADPAPRHPRRRPPAGAAPAPHAGAVLALARRARRRDALPQGREPAEDRLRPAPRRAEPRAHAAPVETRPRPG